MSDIRAQKRERFADELDRWNRQLTIWNSQLGEYPADTPDGYLLRLMISDGEAWVQHYEKCLTR